MKTLLANFVSWLSRHWNKRRTSVKERRQSRMLKAKDVAIAGRDLLIEELRQHDRDKDLQHRSENEDLKLQHRAEIEQRDEQQRDLKLRHRIELGERDGDITILKHERNDLSRAYTSQMQRRDTEISLMERMWERNGHAS